jgi:hypothetical protein
MSRLYYAALDGAGNVLGVERTANDATQLALSLSPGTTVAVQTLDETRENPIAAVRMPGAALKACQIPVVDEADALDMPIEEAHERLLPYFSGLLKRGAEVDRYDTVLGMSKSWIGNNYKTEKKDARQVARDGRVTKVMGVTLVPAFHPYLAATGTGPYAYLRQIPERAKRAEGLRMIDRWAGELDSATGGLGKAKGINFCVGSSQNCRDSCLVFTGQNASELYNSYRKIAQTMALLNEPAAFMRMLYESLRRWFRSREVASGEVAPYVRLNVLSDLPWELICPWLFDVFGDFQFYDYTKVPGRIVPPNYDLTFSISGEDANFEYAQSEIHDRERRIAVVFLGHKRRGESWGEVRQKGKALLEGVPLPRSFWGLPVVDGDISDVRPLDPAPSCVGLRWKTPSGKRSGVGEYELADFSFVVPVYVVSEDVHARYRTAGGMPTEGWFGEEPSPRSDQWLIAPVTPRYQPIDHDVAQVID